MNCYLLLFQVDEHNQQHDAENSRSKDENAIHEESFLIGHDLWHDGIRLRFMGGFLTSEAHSQEYWRVSLAVAPQLRFAQV